MIEQIRAVALWLGPFLACASGYLMFSSGLEFAPAVTVSITIFCVLWWIFEPVPIPVTSLVPLTIFPLLGILTATDIANAYGHPLVLLLLGGFILSTAMEKSGSHRRLALAMVRFFGGTSSKRLVLGFMVASAVLSMWISNTATTLMLLPVAVAVLEKSKDKLLAVPLLLGIAHAASLGGIGTPIGTPPNVVFRGVYEQTFGEDVGFLTWMSWGVSVVVVFLPIMWLWLTRNLTHRSTVEIPEVGKWTKGERRTVTVFGLTALAWIFRKEPSGGWTALLDVPATNDAMVALLAVVVMFLVPDGKGGRLLDWQTANKIPWGMLVLFGAGISIATAFVESGLSSMLGDQLIVLSLLHPLLLIATVCLMVTFLTEATSNTATTNLLMPILAAAAIGAAIDPKLLMVPAAMSASCAFMLPVATPPNLIVFSTERFPVATMVREGTVLNIIGAISITGVCYLLIYQFPLWFE